LAVKAAHGGKRDRKHVPHAWTCSVETATHRENDIDGPDVRLHDLRHSYAGVAASGGQSLVVIAKLLGHSQPATTARYAHLADDPGKSRERCRGTHMAAAMDSGTSGEFVDFAQAKRGANLDDGSRQ
jgi:hypothetical protein